MVATDLFTFCAPLEVVATDPFTFYAPLEGELFSGQVKEQNQRTYMESERFNLFLALSRLSNGLGGNRNYHNCKPGPNDISTDPQFIGIGDFHLQPTSPCIDKGLNTAPSIPDKDKDGNPRIINDIVDIGAYEYQKVGTATKQIESTAERKKEPKPEIAGYTAKFKNINYFLGSMRGEVLKCPKESCNDYEEEAAKVLISHLLTKKSGKWISVFILEKIIWKAIKNTILFGFDESAKMLVDVGEALIKEKIYETKNRVEKDEINEVVSLGWKDIGVLPIYLPYKDRDGRYGRVDGEALMVFYSPHSISIKEIKEQVKSKGLLYVPPIGLDEKLRQLPDEGIVRPFKIIIRGTVYELGEVDTYEDWGETIKGPWVVFLEDKESKARKSK